MTRRGSASTTQGGFEIIAAPELFIAAAAEQTTRIRLGTGVMSLPYHHPFMAAGRISQLDHQTRGRAMFGFGPGLLNSDAQMLGIEAHTQRDRMGEAIDVITRLLDGEIVSKETEWFTLREGRMQLGRLQGQAPASGGDQHHHPQWRGPRRPVWPGRALRRCREQGWLFPARLQLGRYAGYGRQARQGGRCGQLAADGADAYRRDAPAGAQGPGIRLRQMVRLRLQDEPGWPRLDRPRPARADDRDAICGHRHGRPRRRPARTLLGEDRWLWLHAHPRPRMGQSRRRR